MKKWIMPSTFSSKIRKSGEQTAATTSINSSTSVVTEYYNSFPAYFKKVFIDLLTKSSKRHQLLMIMIMINVKG